MISGDGHVCKISGLNTYMTNSYQLALDISFLIKFIGMSVKIYRNKRCYILQFGNLGKKLGSVNFGDASMIEIISIDKEYGNEEVYDISVKNNHNFFAGEFGNILISNSVYPDTTKESFEAAEHLFKISNWDSELVDYEAPFVSYNKANVLRMGIESMIYMEFYEEDIDYILKHTHSCYCPDEGGKSCGQCGTCKERLEAFKANDLEDPVEYV